MITDLQKLKERLSKKPEPFKLEALDSKAPKIETFEAIKNEVIKARTKFPGNDDLLVALMEEVGELAQAHLKQDFENIKKEVIQVAAVAIRILEEGDATFANRKNISQDEKYEYQKIATLNNIKITWFDYVDDVYIFEFNTSTQKFKAVINKKPPYQEFKFLMDCIAIGNYTHGRKEFIIDDWKISIK